MDYTVFFNSKTRGEQPRAGLDSIFAQRVGDYVDLSVGAPSLDIACPFSALTITLRDGEKLEIKDQDLHRWLEYTSIYGVPEFRQQARDIIEHLHKPPLAKKSPDEGGLDIAITNGASEGLRGVFHTLLESGDTVLIQDPAFMDAISCLKSIKVKLLPIAMDSHGVQPESMRQALEKWYRDNPTSIPDTPDRPKLLYIIPTCSNPSGVSTSQQRKEDIYKLAQKYNLLILEDDPYYLLSYAEEYSQSFLSMDVDGRVIRCDSFSKLAAPGFRLGITSAAKPLLFRIIQRHGRETIQPSGCSQVFISQYLKRVGMEGFLAHSKSIAQHYKAMAKVVNESLEQHLKGLAEWNPPDGGFFVWLKLVNVEDAYQIFKDQTTKKILIFPGGSFSVSDTMQSPYIRISFGDVSSENIKEGIRRLADAINKWHKEQKEM